MVKGIYTGASAMMLQILRIETCANNLANANTAGYKKDVNLVRAYPGFSWFRFDNNCPPECVGDLTTTVVVEDTAPIFTQGKIVRTENPLDLAILGDGFFAIDTPSGEMYTRAGNLMLDGEGYLVNQDGFYVLGENGRIYIGDAKRIRVTEDGEIYADGAYVDRLKIVAFEDVPFSMFKVGGTLWKAGENAKAKEPLFSIKQGFLEMSNVNPVEEITKLIEATRAYEICSRSVSAGDAALSRLIDFMRTM